MVDVVGHLGMALIWLSPVWFFIDRPKVAVTFVGIGTVFGLLPDIDLYLSRIFPTIKHHGVTHTILFVTVFAAIAGPILGRTLEKTDGGSAWFSDATEHSATAFGFLAIWIAGLSHIFADMLSAPDIAEAIEAFWPLYQSSIGLDLVWYNAAWFNWGLLIVGLALNAVLWYRAYDEGGARRPHDRPV